MVLTLAPIALAATIFTMLPSVARAQGATRRVEARVTFVTGGAVYLDAGRDAGLAPGDEVVLSPARGDPVRARLSSVSTRSARAELPPGTPAGIRFTGAYVLVSRERPQSRDSGEAAPAQPSQRRVPAHPPWTAPLGEHDPDAPLLRVASARGPAERPMDLRGRAWVHAFATFDDGPGRDGRTEFLRSGAELSARNAFGLGGLVHADAEFAHRAVVLADAADRRDDRVRLRRLSYAWGGTRDEPLRVEGGRFLQSLPELGVLDGIEAAWRSGPATFGASIGWLPEPFADMSSGDDFALAMLYRHAFGAPTGAANDADAERLVVQGAFQKSWHRGKADRDLFLMRGDWNAGNGLLLSASAWVDLYLGADAIKSSGAELTELHLAASQSFDDFGWHASFDRIRWPELRRREFAALPPERIRGLLLARAGAGAWLRASDRLRLDGRLHGFDDREGRGGGAEIGATLADPLGTTGRASAALHWTEGSYLAGPGVRIDTHHDLGGPWLGLGFASAWYETGLSGTNTSMVHRTAYSTLDFDLGSRTSASLQVDASFGDGERAWTLGVFLQTRF